MSFWLVKIARQITEIVLLSTFYRTASSYNTKGYIEKNKTCENPRCGKQFYGLSAGLHEIGRGACAYYSDAQNCCSRNCEQELEELEDLSNFNMSLGM